MKAKLLSVAVVLAALAVTPPALASSGGAGSGGAGGFQAGVQGASTEQVAFGIAKSDQNAVNANVPVNIAGHDVNAGPSSATQTASSSATANVSNTANTDQDQTLNQNIGGSSGCYAGCGGAGGFQAGIQDAQTEQTSGGIAKSDQNAVNANVPVNIAGHDVNSGPSSATQTANSSATTNVSNNAETEQEQNQTQNVGNGRRDSCKAGCGGPGGFQAGIQKSETEQGAFGVAKSDQNAVNANVPVNIAGHDVNSGPSSATQTANSSATTNVSNSAETEQEQELTQNVGGSSSCLAGCGGAGGFQLGVQKAETEQGAFGIAKSDQNAVNANTPVNVAGHDVNSGPSSATQTANSSATANVSNNAETEQEQTLNQGVGGLSSCLAGCGGAGGFQLGVQKAETEQLAFGIAKSDQNAVNTNAPHAVAGWDVNAGPSGATQTPTSSATTTDGNSAETEQEAELSQML